MKIWNFFFSENRDYFSINGFVVQLWSGYHPVIRPVIIQLLSGYRLVVVRLSSIIYSCPSPTDSLISLRYSMPAFSANSFGLFSIFRSLLFWLILLITQYLPYWTSCMYYRAPASRGRQEGSSRLYFGTSVYKILVWRAMTKKILDCQKNEGIHGKIVLNK